MTLEEEFTEYVNKEAKVFQKNIAVKGLELINKGLSSFDAMDIDTKILQRLCKAATQARKEINDEYK